MWYKQQMKLLRGHFASYIAKIRNSGWQQFCKSLGVGEQEA